MPSIVGQIAEVEAEIEKSENRLDTIERRLRLNALTESERQFLHEEEKRMKKALESQKSNLRTLRKENWKSMFVSGTILGIIYLLYCLYNSW